MNMFKNCPYSLHLTKSCSLLFISSILFFNSNTFAENSFKVKEVKIQNSRILLPTKTYTVQDGLVGNRVRALLQDRKGLLWIGTNEGLSIYDGRGFENPELPEGYPAKSVSSLYESHDTTIWIGTHNGDVISYKNEEYRIFNVRSGENQNSVFCFYEDAGKVLWCGTRYGLYRFDGKKFIRDKKYYEFESVKNIYRYNDTLITIVSDFDCYMLNLRNSYSKLIPLGLIRPNSYTLDSIIDDEGNIWIGTSDGNLIQIADQEVKAWYKVSKRYLQPLLCDKEGNIWASDITGLLKFRKSDPSSPVLFTPDNGLPHEGFWTMLEDNEGNLWIGNYSEGLVKIRNQFFFHFPLRNLFNSDTDGNNHIWAANRTEIFEFWYDNISGWISKTHKPIIKGNDEIITMKIQDDDVYLIINKTELHFYKIIPGKNGSSLVPQSKKVVKDDFIYTLTPFEGGLWTGQRGKIYFLSQSAEEETLIKLDPDFYPQTVSHDRSGKLWFSSFGNGLFKVDNPFGNSVIDTIKKLSDIHPQIIYTARTGTVLIGSSGNGLFILKNDKISNIDTEDGLPSNTIWDICEDNDGMIWMATSHGLCYLENENSDNVKVNNLTYGKWVYKCAVLPGKVLWGVDITGMFIYDYGKSLGDHITPGIYIRKVSINGEQRKFYNGMELPPDENNYEIEFIAPFFAGDRSIRYQYSINESEWSVPSGNNRINLAALSPGKYHFRVRAVNNQKNISVNIASWSFTILTPLWQRWWFIMIMAVLLAFLIYIIMLLRINRIRQIERLRTQIASDLHDEIASNLSSITMFSKIIEANPKELPVFIERIANLSTESVNKIRDIIWAIDPKVETINDLLTRLHDLTLVNCKANNIALKFNPPLDHSLPDHNLTSEQRKNIWMMLKEAVINSIKHSNATVITVTAFHSNRMLNIVVKDDGKGFDTSLRYKNKGLQTMKMRAKELGGNVNITSCIDEGTEVYFTIKL